MSFLFALPNFRTHSCFQTLLFQPAKNFRVRTVFDILLACSLSLNFPKISPVHPRLQPTSNAWAADQGTDLSNKQPSISKDWLVIVMNPDLFLGMVGRVGCFTMS